MTKAARDRISVLALLAFHGPLTAVETQSLMRELDGPDEFWDYGRAHNALAGLARRGQIVGAGRGSGFYVLWFIPLSSEVTA